MSPKLLKNFQIQNPMENKKNRMSLLVHVDQDGNLREASDFDNAMKFDSPAVVRALRKRLKG